MKSNKYQEEEFEKYLRGEISLVDDEHYDVEEDKIDTSLTKGDSYDPFALISRTIASDFDSSVFETIDDSDLPLAANWLEFCISNKYLNFKPYPKQIKFGLEFFSDYCPDCSDPDMLDDLFDQPLQEILDRIQLLHYGKCPKCNKTRLEFAEEGKLHFYNELAGCAGQRGGKSAFVAMCATYQLHRYLKLPNPSHYFNTLRNQALHMTFVAITYGQAEDTLWQPFRSFYDDCPWFKSYNELLDFYSSKHGLELYKNKDTFLWYDHKRLTCYASGPDKRKLRGRTRFFCAVDELGWFHGTEKAMKLNPDQVCQALERSLRTVRSASNLKRKQLHKYDSPDGLFINVSSPSAANDKIMRLVRNKNIPTRYCFHVPTWEMNPNITREDLEAEYQDDPIGAERDYGANPPLSDSPYISNPDILKILIGKYKNRCKYETIYEIDRNQHMTIKIKKFTFKPLDSGINYIIGVDTGHTKNAFAVVLQHYDLASNSSIVDMMIEVRPNDNSSVHFPSMFKKIIEPLVDNAHIALVVFDKWQSINYEQELHDKGIESVRYSMKHEDFTNIRGLMFSRKLVIPIPEIPFNELINPSKDYHAMIENKPVSHFIYQVLTVRDLGRTVAKGLGVDDDIFRAWCLGTRFLFDKKYEKIFHQEYLAKKRKTCVGITFGKSTNTMFNSQLMRMNSKIVKGSGNKPLGTIQCKKGLK